jgi:hypothetical protein
MVVSDPASMRVVLSCTVCGHELRVSRGVGAVSLQEACAIHESVCA